MLIIPVLYILDGRCVALYKGSFDQKEEYFKHPADMARTFERDGASLLYISDLNPKIPGQSIQQKLIEQMVNSVHIPIWLEANFSDIEPMRQFLDKKIQRLVLVSPSLEFLQQALQTFGNDRIIVQILGKQSLLLDSFESNTSEPRPSYVETDVVDYAEKIAASGITEIIYKDKWSEGTMIHPDYDEIDRLILTLGPNVNIYASGGIGDLQHLKLLKKIGAAGALIGKALYEKNFNLTEAIELFEDKP